MLRFMGHISTSLVHFSPWMFQASLYSTFFFICSHSQNWSPEDLVTVPQIFSCALILFFSSFWKTLLCHLYLFLKLLLRSGLVKTILSNIGLYSQLNAQGSQPDSAWGDQDQTESNTILHNVNKACNLWSIAQAQYLHFYVCNHFLFESIECFPFTF